MGSYYEDECADTALVDVSDLDSPSAERANWAVCGSDILCPRCFDTLNPISV